LSYHLRRKPTRQIRSGRTFGISKRKFAEAPSRLIVSKKKSDARPPFFILDVVRFLYHDQYQKPGNRFASNNELQLFRSRNKHTFLFPDMTHLNR